MSYVDNLPKQDDLISKTPEQLKKAFDELVKSGVVASINGLKGEVTLKDIQCSGDTLNPKVGDMNPDEFKKTYAGKILYFTNPSLIGLNGESYAAVSVQPISQNGGGTIVVAHTSTGNMYFGWWDWTYKHIKEQKWIKAAREDTLDLNAPLTKYGQFNIGESTCSQLMDKGIFKMYAGSDINKYIDGVSNWSTILGITDKFAGKNIVNNSLWMFAFGHENGEGANSIQFKHITNGSLTPNTVRWTRVITNTWNKQEIQGELKVKKLESATSVYVDSDRISTSQDDGLAPSTYWINRNVVKSINGVKGETSLRKIICREKIVNHNIAPYKSSVINNRYDYAHFWFTSKNAKYVGLPAAPTVLEHIPMSLDGSGSIQRALSYDNKMYFRYMDDSTGIMGDSDRWEQILSDRNLNNTITISSYDLRNKQSSQLAALGFRKLRGSKSLGYPADYCTALSIPAITNDYIDCYQLAFSSDGLHYRYLYNNTNTNDTPWQTMVSKDYVDNAIKKALGK